MENRDIEVQINDMEGIINSLPDVMSSKIIFNKNEIEEIHVLASNRRGPKQISRDIQSALTAKFDVKVDYKKISVAQIDVKQNLTSNDRIKIDSIQYSLMGHIAQVNVSLLKDEEKVGGTAKGIGSKNNVHRLVSRATLNCIHQLLGVDELLTVEDVEKLTLAKKEVMVVAVSCISSETEELLTGSAIVKKDEHDAIVKATLDAINRRMARFLD